MKDLGWEVQEVNEWWALISKWFKMQDNFSLIAYSIIFITGIILFIFIYQKKTKLWVAFLTAFIFDFIIITSTYECYKLSGNSPQNIWAVASSSLLFLLSIFLKTLICFLLYSLLLLITKPETLNEFVAKFFGVEIQYKRAEKLNIALNNALESKKQLEFIEALNEQTLEYISGPFEEGFIEIDNPGQKIREVVEGILTKVYLNSQVKIFVIPVTETGMKVLDRKYRSLIKLEYNRNQDCVTILKNRVGIGIYRAGEDDNDTVIIIDTTDENYKLTPTEMSAISNLYVSIATIVGWARLANDQV